MSSATTVPATSPASAPFAMAGVTRPHAESVFRFVALTLTLTFAPLLCLGIAYVAEPDIWWHITSGDWMFAHHAFPRVDTFSSTTAGHPWQAYSWLFELLLSVLYRHFGLAGVVAYAASMVLAISAALWFLIYNTQKSLRVALPLTAVSSFALLTLYSPRPWHFTILFFIVELILLQRGRRTGNRRELFLLPVIFCAWANLHIQFIDGLLLLALVLVEAVLFARQRSTDFALTRITPRMGATLLLACVCATMVNPYGWHIYTVAHDLASQPGVLNGIEELKAMPFRSLSNYVVLALTLAASAALAHKRRFHFFETALLVGATLLAFRSQRDIWIVVAVSAAILSGINFAAEEHTACDSLPLSTLGAIATAALLLVGAAHLMRLNNDTLQPKLTAAMPVDAAKYVHDHHLHGPVFCDFVWGGYLMHALGMQVSIDGRAALHGDEQLDRSARTWAGAPDWAWNPQLVGAGVLVGRTDAALTQLLRMDPRFQLVYEDKLAVVFIPHTREVASVASLH